MPVTFRQAVAAAAVCVMTAAVVVPRAAGAQAAERRGAPVEGTWGAETSVGDGQNAVVLRFLSARWALQGGGSIRTFQSDGSERRFTSTAALLGVRRYGGSGLGFRPISGAGVSVGRFTSRSTQVGVFGELGAAYFFNPAPLPGRHGAGVVQPRRRTRVVQPERRATFGGPLLLTAGRVGANLRNV